MGCTLSISIVVYRDYDDALKAVESIEAYTDINLKKKIHVIDNSAYESTTQAQRDFIEKLRVFNDVVYIDTKKNLGFGKGHNYILQQLESDFHAIVNPDIVIKEDVFCKLIAYLRNNDSIGMCIPKIVTSAGGVQPVYRRELSVFDIFIRIFCKSGFSKRHYYHTMQDMDYSKEFQVPFGQGSFLVIRTLLFKQLDGFDDRYFMYLEDADLCRRVNQVSKLMYYPGATVVHKWKQGSHRNLKLFKIHLNSMFAYFAKWGVKWV